MEIDSSNDDILEMIKRFVVLKVDMKTVFNSDFHFHGNNLSGPFDFFIGQQNCKINLFDDIEFSGNNHPDKVSDSTSNTFEGLIFFFEVGKLKVELLVFSEDTCGLQFF